MIRCDGLANALAMLTLASTGTVNPTINGFAWPRVDDRIISVIDRERTPRR